MEQRFASFTTSILKISRAILKIKTIEMEKYGLKPIHAICIYYLNLQENGMSQAQLMKNSGEDKALISRAVKTLLEKKFIISEDNKKYNSILKLTPSGKEIAIKINEIIFQIFNNVGKDLTIEEKSQFYYALELITKNIEIYLQNYERKD